jgi:hypothetical protein
MWYSPDPSEPAGTVTNEQAHFMDLWDEVADELSGFYVGGNDSPTYAQDHAACLADAKAGVQRAEAYIAKYLELRMKG